MASINTLPISPGLRLQLLQVGLTNSREILGQSVTKLAGCLKLTESEANAVQDHIRRSCSLQSQPRSVSELLRVEAERGSVVTMCRSFDEMLGEGIPCGRLTEICGAAGVGKTQFCFQACVTVQLPVSVGGENGEVIFIDTEGSFSVSRISQMAAACLAHCRSCPDTDSSQLADLSVEEMLQRIRYIRCSDHKQLLSLTYRLPSLVEKSAIKLVVIDSIAFHFRYDFEDILLRNRHLAVIAQNLFRLLQTAPVAVLVTNQMTTRFDAAGEGFLTPALGDNWGHVCALRVLLERDEGRRRRASLVKHPGRPESSCFFQVTSGGVRDFV